MVLAPKLADVVYARRFFFWGRRDETDFVSDYTVATLNEGAPGRCTAE